MIDSVIVMGALPESLLNFRGDLIKLLNKRVGKVIGMASGHSIEVIEGLRDIGVDYYSYPIERNRINPIADLTTYRAMRKIFKKSKPSVVLAYTIKPVIWGGLAVRVLPKAKFYAMITGLGFAFQGHSLKRKLLSKTVSFLYKVSLRRAEKVIFQNQDNLETFISNGIVPRSKCELVNGSGVNLDYFEFSKIPQTGIVFLAIGRLLGEKGFREYAEAAKSVKKMYPNVSFRILGPEDPSPDGIPMSEVESWCGEGGVEYLGFSKEVLPYLKSCHVYVLPSYHEGMPRTVLEAMAVGRPILTTDVPGCRETVIEKENGFLVPKQDSDALARQMIWFIENRDQWQKMGNKSRELVEEKFDVTKVNASLMEIMDL